MHETTDTNTLTSHYNTIVRELNKDFYTNYSIEAESTTEAYKALATLAEEVSADGGIVEAVSPSFHFEDPLPYQLLVTVSR